MKAEKLYKNTSSLIIQSKSQENNEFIDNRLQAAVQAKLINNICNCDENEYIGNITQQKKALGQLANQEPNLCVIQAYQMVIQRLSAEFKELYSEFCAFKLRIHISSTDSALALMRELDTFAEKAFALQGKDENDKSSLDELIAELVKYQQALQSPMWKIIFNEDWNNSQLVKAIGEQAWEITKDQWNSLHFLIPGRINKFSLVRLRGKPYEKAPSDVAPSDVVDSYAGWPDVQLEEQSGFKWGVEIEDGGGILAKLRTPVSDSGTLKKRREELVGVLDYLKRNPLVKTDYGSLTIDNVMHLVDSLLDGKTVEFPVEIASKPNEIEEFGTWKALNAIDAANRKSSYPKIELDENKLKGETAAVDIFNKHFLVELKKRGRQLAPIQHITVSGYSEDRMKMAKELVDTSEGYSIDKTSSKSKLSLKPKTSMELLRFSRMGAQDVRSLEKSANQVRLNLKAGTSSDIKFADECLNAIIIPNSGAPRQIGGYFLTTPMTNVFPVIPLEKGGITILRENRSACQDIRSKRNVTNDIQEQQRKGEPFRE